MISCREVTKRRFGPWSDTRPLTLRFPLSQYLMKNTSCLFHHRAISGRPLSFTKIRKTTQVDYGIPVLTEKLRKQNQSKLKKKSHKSDCLMKSLDSGCRQPDKERGVTHLSSCSLTGSDFSILHTQSVQCHSQSDGGNTTTFRVLFFSMGLRNAYSF